MRKSKEQRSKERRYRDAVHEAGHAVVALHYGFKLRPKRCVVLREDGGTTYFTVPAHNPVHDAVAGSAGLAAEWLLDGTRYPSRRAEDDSFEDTKCVEHSLVGEEPRLRAWRSGFWRAWFRVEPALVRQAKSILRRRWRTVKAVAADLAERGSLDRHEVERIYRRGRRA